MRAATLPPGRASHAAAAELVRPQPTDCPCPPLARPVPRPQSTEHVTYSPLHEFLDLIERDLGEAGRILTDSLLRCFQVHGSFPPPPRAAPLARCRARLLDGRWQPCWRAGFWQGQQGWRLP